MSVPQCREGVGTYTLTWEEEALQIVVSGARMHTRDQRITGEIVVSHLVEGKPKHIWRTTHNFISGQSKTRLAKDMEGRFPGPVWSVILEQLSEYVLVWVRTGEPVRVLNSEDEYPQPEHLLYPILLKGQPNVIFGEGESAKSMLAEVFGMLILLPETDCGLGLAAARPGTTTLVLDWETNYDEYGWRLQCLQRGLGLPYVEMPYRRCSLPLADDLEQIQKAVSETGASNIIVDSMAGAAGGDLNAAEPAIRLFGAIRQLNVSSILVGHTSKDEQKRRTVYGNVFFNNYARAVWLAKRESEDGDDEIRVGLFHRKHNNSRGHAPLGFKFSFFDDHTSVERADIRDTAMVAEEMSANSKILNLLRDGALKPTDLAKALGMKDGTVRQAIRRFKRKGFVIQLDDGRYGLPAHPGGTD